MFEKDQIKYDTYQKAVCKALEDWPKEGSVPVIMVVGAGRGPLVQAVLNVSYMLQRKVKVYAVEKNPYAVNTLIDRVNNEWMNQVTLVSGDMRTYEPPEKADILVSELLGIKLCKLFTLNTYPVYLFQDHLVIMNCHQNV